MGNEEGGFTTGIVIIYSGDTLSSMVGQAYVCTYDDEGYPQKLSFFGRRRYIRPTTTRKREKHKNKLAQSTTSYTVDDGGLRGGRPQMNG